jgi:hypothetical protein
MNRLNRNVMGLSEFPDTPTATGHSPLRRWYRRWKPLSSGISDSLPPPKVSPPLPFENCLYVHSRQGLVMVDLLDNFLNPLKLFLAVMNEFPKSPWRRFGGGQVRTKTADRLQPIRWEIGRKTWNKSFWKWKALDKIFCQAISRMSVAPHNLGVRVRSKHTPYAYTPSLKRPNQNISKKFMKTELAWLL